MDPFRLGASGRGIVSYLQPIRGKIDPVKASVDWWDACSRAAEIGWTRVGGARAVSAAAARRTKELLEIARARSPFHQERWRGLPGDRLSLQDVPVVTKGELMARFDDWATDRSVTREAVSRFLADRAQIGELFLGKYLVWKSSGSTGETGIFVQDRAALSVYDSLLAVQMQSARVASRYAWGFFAQGAARRSSWRPATISRASRRGSESVAARRGRTRAPSR